MVQSKPRGTKLQALLLTLLLALFAVPTFAFADEGGADAQDIATQDDLVDISGWNAKKFDDSYAYTGDVISITPKVSKDDVTLVQGTDYDVVVQQNGADVELKEQGTYDVAIVGKGDYTGKIAKQVKVVPYFTVYLKSGDSDAVAKKVYNTAAEFAALKSPSSDPVSALYYGSGTWSVATAATYVTLADLLEDAGISAQWAKGASIAYDGGTFTYEQVQAMSKFFPGAKLGESSLEKAAVDAPFVFSLTEYADSTSAEADAEAVQAANVASANGKNTPRVVFGIDEESYKAPSADTSYVAGRRLWSNVTSVTIAVPEAPHTAPIAPVITATDKSIAMGKTVEIGAKVNSGGKLTYTSSNTSVAKVDASGKVTPVKVGSANITIKADAKGDYADGTKTIKVTVSKGANTLSAKGKSVSIKAGKSQKIAKGITVKSAKGAVSYAKKSGTKKITVKNGKIIVAKGLKKGTYTIKVNVTAKGNANWKSKTVKNVSVKVQVK